MEVWMHVVAALSASVVSLILVFICIFCYKHYRQPKHAHNEEISIGKAPFKTNSPYIVALSGQSSIAKESPQGLPVPYSEQDKIWHPVRSNGSSDNLIPDDNSFTFEDMLYYSNEEHESLSRYSSRESILDDGPTINFTLSWNENNKVLSVKVLNITNLPQKYGDNCSSYVKVILFAHKKAALKSHIRKKSGINPLYRELFEFGGYTLDEIMQFYLKLSVYVKENLRNKLIGDVTYFLGKAELNSDKLMICSEDLMTKKKIKLEKQSPSKRSISSFQQVEIGQLFISLQYQSKANRLKVLIRKAENLIKKSRLPSHSDHYIIINLMKDKDKVLSKETKGQSGLNPVWNEPFLFDVDSNFIDDYWLQILVMKARIYHKDDMIGHVLIGHGTTKTGVTHWQAVIARSLTPVEVAKWHSILYDTYH